MSCLLPLIAGACLLEPSHISLSADTSVQLSGDVHHVDHGRDFHGGHVARVRLEAGGRIGPRVSLYYGIEHTSLLDTTGDRGEERAYLGLTWRPFR